MIVPRPQLIDRDKAVLVVIDIQERLAAAMDRRAEVVAATSRLLAVAELLGIPVIVTRQYPKGLGDTVPELAEQLVAPDPIDKTVFCCRREPLFVERLAATDRSQVVIAGMETHICVTQTALALHADGYEVHVVADAVCSRLERDHDVALERMRAAGAIVTTTESVIYEALGEAGTPEFKAVLEIVKNATPQS